jgi:hypothetical protein
MSKLTDTLKQALQKKKGNNHVDVDADTAVDKKIKSKAVPVITGRPIKKASGRGR